MGKNDRQTTVRLKEQGLPAEPASHDIEDINDPHRFEHPMTPEQELDGWKLAFSHAIMRGPEEAFAYKIDGKSIATRAQEFFEKEITKRNIATIRIRHDLLEAWDLVAIMRSAAYKKRNWAALDMAYDLIAWLMCKGESAQPFEGVLEIGRTFMRENKGVVTRIIDGKPQPGKDYRK